MALYLNRKKMLISLEENLFDAVKKSARSRTWPVTTWIQEAIREKLGREISQGWHWEFEQQNKWLKHPSTL